MQQEAQDRRRNHEKEQQIEPLRDLVQTSSTSKKSWALPLNPDETPTGPGRNNAQFSTELLSPKCRAMG